MRLSRKARTQRNQLICQQYLAGETQENLATLYNVTTQRIGQVLHRNGLSGKDRPMTAKKTYAGLSIAESVKSALREIAEERGISMSELAEEVFRSEFGDRVVEAPLAPLPQLPFEDRK